MPKARKPHATRHHRSVDPTAGLPPLNLKAAGIDGGSAEPDVAVPPARSPEPGRRFARCTADRHALADGLPVGHIKTGVMESPEVSGIPLGQSLEAQGFDVHVATARHANHWPGRPTDMADCQGRQRRPTDGLRNSSFRPTDDIGVLRSYLRPRDPLISAASPGIQPRQKALAAMHVPLAHVRSDIREVPGLAIIRARLAGERDPATRAAVKDDRSTASPHPIAKSRAGNWRAALLFTRRQSRERSEVYQQKIAECDTQIEAHRHTCASTIEVQANAVPTATRGSKQARRTEPPCDLHTQRYRISGVDLPHLDGIEVLTAQTRIAAIGLDLSRGKTDTHFASWRGLWPDHRISGGQGRTRGTRQVVHRAADALRLAAQHLLPSKSAWGANDRRLRARLGAPKAIPAMAHKLARRVSRMLNSGQQYVDQGMEPYEARFQPQRLQGLQRQARELYLHLVPN
jgi:hypothetical protein